MSGTSRRTGRTRGTSTASAGERRPRAARRAAGPSIPFDPPELTGRARTHVVDLEAPRCTLHRAVVAPFLALRAAAAKDGIDLAPASSFRDFERQRAIWNGKWRGERPLLGADGRPLDAARLTDAQRVDAILLWSALPGLSRHHWGTDLDVWDRAAVPADYRVQLVPAEYAPGGPFARLGAWLDAKLPLQGFYRPYATDRGGVRPEPWHLSHGPTAREASKRLRPATVARALREGDVDGSAAVLRRLRGLYARYARAVDRYRP